MRALTLLVDMRSSHPDFRLFDEASGISRERVYHVNILENGTTVMLGRLRGDLDRARQLIEDRLDVLGLSISGDGDEGGLVYIHTQPPSEIRRFLKLPREHEVFFDFPVEGTRDGKLRVVMVGETNEVLQEALEDIPAEINVTVERISPYLEHSTNVMPTLTDRQREVLDVALELGYYNVPRRATHHDIAELLGLTVGTVSEHLQKVEARVFGALFDHTTG